MPQESPIAFSDEQRTSSDLVKLIRKLRWIGMEEEAHKLQASLSEIPPDERATVSASLPNTD
jgi:hypothetical protein